MWKKRPVAIVNPSSGALLNASAPETAGANQEALDTAGRGGAHFLEVWVPSPLGLVVGMADVVADRGAFAANRTMSHREIIFPCFSATWSERREACSGNDCSGSILHN